MGDDPTGLRLVDISGALRPRALALALASLLILPGGRHLAAQGDGGDLRAAGDVPAIRTVTAFIRLDPLRYRDQIHETLSFLRSARAAFEAGGYPVQSLRISTQPFPEYAAGLPTERALALFRRLDSLAGSEGVALSIGPAMLAADADPAQADLLEAILRETDRLSGSLVVADSAGVRWGAVERAAGIVRALADHSAGGMRNFGFAAAALVPPGTPFYPVSYLGPGPDRRFAVGLQSAGVVARSLSAADGLDAAAGAVAEALGRHARAVEELARRVADRDGWAYGGIDLSPAPAGDVSIGRAIERLTGVPVGMPGTLDAAARITDALGTVPVRRAGYSGLMLPVLEDAVLARRWSEGTLTLQGLLAYSAVCAAGLDTVPLPGDATLDELGRIIGDVASLASKLRKPLSARLFPVPGRGPGDRVRFPGGFLEEVTLQPLR